MWWQDGGGTQTLQSNGDDARHSLLATIMPQTLKPVKVDQRLLPSVRLPPLGPCSLSLREYVVQGNVSTEYTGSTRLTLTQFHTALEYMGNLENQCKAVHLIGRGCTRARSATLCSLFPIEWAASS